MSFSRRTNAAWAIHPGEILQEEFLRPLGMSGYALAKAIVVKPQSVNDIVLQKRGISADMAVRLARFFGTSPEFWMNLQSAYELAKVRTTLGRKIEKIQPHRSAA
jgi:addiction module HigA family antidote